MKTKHLFVLALVFSLAILVTARKGRKKKERKQAPQWKSSSMPHSGTFAKAVDEGQDDILDCKSKGSPKPTVTWLKDGVELGAYDNVEIKKGGVLKLKSVTTDNSGNYTCKVANKHGELEWTFHVDVQVKIWPLNVEGPNNITELAGSSVAFRCRVLNDPTATIRWVGPTRGDNDPQPKFLKEGDDSQVLELKNIQKENEGEYTCMAGNIHGLKRSKAWLHVIEPVVIPDTIEMEKANSNRLEPGSETGTDDSSVSFFPGKYDPAEGGTGGGIFDYNPDYYPTTKRPRNRKKNRKNRKNKNRNKNRDNSDSAPDMYDNTRWNLPSTTTTTTTDMSTPLRNEYHEYDRTSKIPGLWNYNENTGSDYDKDFEDGGLNNGGMWDPNGDMNSGYDKKEGVSDTTTKPPLIWNLNNDIDEDYDKNYVDDRLKKPKGEEIPERSEQDDKKSDYSISSWTIYTIVGAIGGVVLLIGLVAITLTLCCKKEEGGTYKATPV